LKPVRWTSHAEQNRVDREIDRKMADATLAEPHHVVQDTPTRRILMRRYFDHVLGQEMLIRLVTEEMLDETVVITVYKTSQLSRYLRNVTP